MTGGLFMSKLIITTVGTSIINNKYLITKNSDKEKVKDLQKGKISDDDYSDIFNKTVNKLKETISNNGPNDKLSAELASLRTFKQTKEYGLDENDVIELLSTDTEDGVFCADVNKKVLESLGWCQICEPIRIEGLQTKETEKNKNITKNFIKYGLKNFDTKVKEIINSKLSHTKYFNITGGFKGTIPYSTILAFANEMHLIYLYEESKDLIVIPPPYSKYSIEQKKDIIKALSFLTDEMINALKKASISEEDYSPFSN